MLRLIAFDHPVNPELGRMKRSVIQADGRWSPRRRFVVLVGCVAGSWLLLLAPLLLWH